MISSLFSGLSCSLCVRFGGFVPVGYAKLNGHGHAQIAVLRSESQLDLPQGTIL